MPPRLLPGRLAVSPRGRSAGASLAAAAADPNKPAPPARAPQLCTPLVAARAGFLDDVIAPRDTRARLCAELGALLGGSRTVARAARKHCTMPL